MAVIAVVDDDEAVRRSMKRLLQASGYAVALYADGPEFLESLERERPACVIVDGQMLGMDGWEVLRLLADRAPGVPAFVVTGHDSPEFRQAARACGAVAFFTKPFDPDVMLAALASAVGS
jgi:FixJ family two-component response regulator